MRHRNIPFASPGIIILAAKIAARLAGAMTVASRATVDTKVTAAQAIAARMTAYYGDRDAFFRGNNGRAMLFQRVREDLDHATSGAFPFTGDRARLDRTQDGTR